MPAGRHLVDAFASADRLREFLRLYDAFPKRHRVVAVLSLTESHECGLLVCVRYTARIEWMALAATKQHPASAFFFRSVRMGVLFVNANKEE